LAHSSPIQNDAEHLGLHSHAERGNDKPLFPIYENFKQYGAIATFHINADAKREALRRGYFVLQRSGDLVHTECAEALAIL
jgi:hypothetical protein